MSVINAIIELRIYRSNTGIDDMRECCRLLRVTPGSVATFDYSTAIELSATPGLFEGNGEPRIQRFREILRYLIIHHRPLWGLLIPQGRQIFASNVGDDVFQCFATAGLLESDPDEDSVAWWDSLSDYFRSTSVLGRVELGRRGEMLSMEYERRRLAVEGNGHLHPRWIAIDDNTVGYDIESFHVQAGATAPKYIEVKASEQKPFMFFISENEWKTAQAMGDRYVFHFWRLPAAELWEVPSSEVAPHIPENNGRGLWKKTLIVWPNAT